MADTKAILRDYLNDIRRIRGTGHAVPETSYYGKMETLFTEIGKAIKPAVFCVLNIKNRGAGIPDGGLFIDNQQNIRVDKPGFGQLPARGVIEAKSTSTDIMAVAHGEQVAKYLTTYGQVLVTNFYQFILVTQDAYGVKVVSKPYSLADNEGDFWSKSVASIVKDQTEGLVSFLQHVMMSAAPISEPKDLASTLAFYARDAKARIERGDVDTDRLEEIKADFEAGLGIKFEGKQGQGFFRSTLVQTLFYGVFSAWVLWSETSEASSPDAKFEWRMSAWQLHVPVIRGLFERLATRSTLDRLDLIEVLDWTSDVLNRVKRQVFFEKFNTGEAIQYFYEPFLAEFDPQLRKDLGVWYTPPEIVEYMVERADRVLREELGRLDGLADENVYVLDPATGTGAYLAAVLKRIYKTRERNDGIDAARNALRDAVRNYIGKDPKGRIFGFEILPAPFVVAHLRLALLLQQYGVPLHDNDERIGVYLTNSLTGWLPPEGDLYQPMIQALADELDQANKVKRERKILVVIGNPPYDAFGGTSTDEEKISAKEGLVDRYKEGLSKKWGIKKYNLDDLYIRFFRIAERIVAESTGEGIVCYISNKSYINYPSFVVMREHLLNEFDLFWFDNMNGDSRETGKKTPDGKPDPSVFSTEYNRAGIRQGTAIGLLVRKHSNSSEKVIRYREFWGVNKRNELLASLSDNEGRPLNKEDFNASYQVISPTKTTRHSFLGQDISNDYLSWPLVTDLCVQKHNGLLEKRSGGLIDIDRALLKSRMETYYDSNIDWTVLESLGSGLTQDAAGYNAEAVRAKVQKTENFSEEHIVRYEFHPFDIRFAYYSDVSPLWNRARTELWQQLWDGNSFFVTRPTNPVDHEGIPVSFTNLLGDNDYQRGHSYYFPIQLLIKPDDETKNGQQVLLNMSELDEVIIKANLSDRVT